MPSPKTVAAPAPRARAAPAGRPRRFLLAATLFFFSGALGLGYELVWIRKAALVVGASHVALATVLTSFFLGLGLGSLVVGRLRGARRSPLATYGLFELGIGAYALAFPLLFELLESVYGALYPLAASSGAALFALRFALLFALCLPPTFLMGGTLPLLLDGLVEEDRAIGSQTSLLYGINVLGAVVGVLATCYLAIPTLGMDGTSRVGGLGNLAIGALALVLFRGGRPLHAPSELRERPRTLFAVLAFGTGAVSIGWQVLHARFFSLLDVTTIHTTAMLLAVYLLGLSLGSLALARILRGGREPLAVFAFAQALVPLVGLFSFHAVRWITVGSQVAVLQAPDGSFVPLDTLQVRPVFAFFSEDLDRDFFGPLAKIGLVVLLPVLFLGACLPALIAGATRHSAALRNASGSLVFWNTLGASTGAFAAGYVLLPGLGLHRSVALLGFGSLVLAAAAWRGAGARSGLARAPALIALGAASLAAIAGFVLFGGDLTRTAILRYGLMARFDDPLAGPARVRELHEVVESTVGTVYVFEDEQSIHLASDGVAFAAVAKQGVAGQAIQGHIPMLLFPGEGTPRRCLGVCMGSGQSFGAMLMYDIESLDVVDISPALVELSLQRFAEFNHGLGTDERVRFHSDDGRHHVQRAPDAHYDVISMEPPPPNADGVYSLYSLDFYREVRRTLTEQGVFMQWLPIYRISPEDALGIMKTQSAVFPDTYVVKQGEQDFMVLSYKSPPSLSADAIRRRCEVFARERGVARARWAPGCQAPMASLEGVLSSFLIGPEAIARMQAPEPYEDDTQLLCYGTGDRWIYHRYVGPNLSRITYAALPQSPLVELASVFSPPLPDEVVARAILDRVASLAFFRAPDPRLRAQLEGAAASAPSAAERARAELALAELDDAGLRKGDALEHVARAIAADPSLADDDARARVRRIARNHYAVYRELVRERVEELRRVQPASPLVAEMSRAIDEVERLEDERRASYLFPER